MRIVVLIKQVPGTANTRMDPETGVMIRDAGESILNPLDEHAVAEAVAIKKRQPGTEVIALTMGPPSADKVLREACARGADQGILLSHRAFGGSDTVATSRVLAAAIRKIGNFDLVLAGEKATDGETGQTGPMTAALLDIPVITFVYRLEIGAGHVIARRLVEEGSEEVRADLPALVTVVKDINEPPLPTLKGYILAKKLTFPVWGPEDLDVEAGNLGLKGSPTRVVKVFTPKLSRQTTFYNAGSEDDMPGAAAAILKALHSRGIVEKGEHDGA